MKIGAALKAADKLGHNISVRSCKQGHNYLLLLNVDGGCCSRVCDAEDAEAYVTHLVEQWEGARKEKERAELAAQERAEYERFHGFTDSMTPMQRGRTVKTLEKKVRYRAEESVGVKGGVMSRARHIEQLAEAGCTSRVCKGARGKMEYWVDVPANGGYIVTKTEYEYFKYVVALATEG